ncbi:MAG: tetratricopeptide repeat protein [Bacteroidota bacterium]
MEKDDTINNIHRYLLNDMSDDEKHKFEATFDADDVVKKNVEMEKRFLDLLDLASDVELKNTISSVHEGLKKNGFFEEANKGDAKIVDIRKRKTASRMLYAIAATVALVIAAWFLIDTVPFDPAIVYANNYSQEKILIDNFIENGFTPGEDVEFQMGLDQYSKGEYQSAKKLLSEFASKTPGHAAARFYLALCEMELNNFDEAVKLLEPLSDKVSDVQNSAKWYLSLAYLKTGQTNESKQLLDSLTKSKNKEYREKANSILTEWE